MLCSFCSAPHLVLGSKYHPRASTNVKDDSIIELHKVALCLSWTAKYRVGLASGDGNAMPLSALYCCSVCSFSTSGKAVIRTNHRTIIIPSSYMLDFGRGNVLCIHTTIFQNFDRKHRQTHGVLALLFYGFPTHKPVHAVSCLVQQIVQSLEAIRGEALV